MKAGPFVVSGVAHLGVLWALLAAGREPTRPDQGPALIQFEPVSRVEPKPEPKLDSEPASDPEPQPQENPDHAPAPSQPHRSVKPKPAASANSEPGNAEQGPGPRRLDLTFSNADGSGPASAGGDAQGQATGKANAGASTTKQPACKEAATKPKPIERVTIEYPPKARAMGLEGRLVLQATVGASGSVESVKVLESVGSAIDEPARAAMKQWRFEPATRCGKPVASSYVIAREFRLGD